MKRHSLLVLLILFLAFWAYHANLSLWWMHQHHLLSTDEVERVEVKVGGNQEGTGYRLSRSATPEETGDIIRWYNQLHFFITLYANGFTPSEVQILLKSGDRIYLRPHRNGVEISGTGGYGWYTAKQGELEEFFKKLSTEAKKAGQ